MELLIKAIKEEDSFSAIMIFNMMINNGWRADEIIRTLETLKANQESEHGQTNERQA